MNSIEELREKYQSMERNMPRYGPLKRTKLRIRQFYLYMKNNFLKKKPLIAYKATVNGKALHGNGIFYQVGKTYTCQGRLEMCWNGFHFHENLFDIYNYYDKTEETKIFEIEVLGKVITKGDKSVTNKFKVLREISTAGMTLEKKGNVKKYDANNNLIYFKHKIDDNYVWKRWEYDENNRETLFEDSDGYWYKIKYDEKGKIVSFRNGDVYQ